MNNIGKTVVGRPRWQVGAVSGFDAETGQALEQDGYAVVKRAFSADEIAEMRDEAKALLALKASPLNGGLNSGSAPTESPLASRLLSDPRLAPFFDGEGPYKVHVHAETYNDWHRDVPPVQSACNPMDVAYSG